MPSNTVIEKWHEFANGLNDESKLLDLLADDACFLSPVVYSPQKGKDLTFKYLCAAAKVFNGNGFHYLNEWVGEKSAVLEFEATVEGIVVNGVDMIFWNDDGKINQFKVMVRPFKAINTLMKLMAEQLMK
jgi:hypothetical protein